MPGKSNYITAYPIGTRVEVKPPCTASWCSAVVITNPPLRVKIDDGHPLWDGAELAIGEARIRKRGVAATTAAE